MREEWRRGTLSRREGRETEEERPRKKRKKRGEWRKDADHSWGLKDLTEEEAGIKRWLYEECDTGREAIEKEIELDK